MSDHESFTPRARTLNAGAPAWTPAQVPMFDARPAPAPYHPQQPPQPTFDAYGHFEYLRHEYAKMGAQYAHLMAEQARLQEWENDLRRREGLLNMAHTRGSGRSVRGRWHGGRGRGGGRGTHGNGPSSAPSSVPKSAPSGDAPTPANSYSSILKAASRAKPTDEPAVRPTAKSTTKTAARPTRPPQCTSKSSTGDDF